MSFSNIFGSTTFQDVALLMVIIGQALLWLTLIRLHIQISKENPSWEEAVGKIRSAFLRNINGEEEREELKVHRYAPIVDRLVQLNFEELSQELMTRYLLLRWKLKERIRPFWVSWGYQIIFFGIIVWLLYGLQKEWVGERLVRTPVDPRFLWVWLGGAMFQAWRLVALEGNLERVIRSLLFPRRNE